MFPKVIQTFATSLAIALASFLTTSILSKLYGSAGLGEVGIFSFSVSLIAVLAAVFGSNTIVYILPRFKFNVVYVVCAAWSFISSILFVFACFIANYELYNLKWLIVISIFQSLMVNNLSFLLAVNKVRYYNFFRIIQPISLLALLFFGAYLVESKDFQFYFLYYFISVVLALLVSSFYLLQYFKKDVFKVKDYSEVVKAFFKFGGIGQLTNLFQLLNYRFCYFFLLFFCSEAEVGKMVLALTFVDGIWLFKNSVSLLKYVQTSINDEKSNDNKSLIKVSFIVTFSLLLVALIIPNSIYIYFFGKDFSALKVLLLLMSPGILCMTATSIYANYFAGIGKVKFNLCAAIGGFVFFIPSVYLFTKYFGLNGAAIANNIPLMVGSIITLYLYRRYRLQNN